jgi:hypothetical protein
LRVVSGEFYPDWEAVYRDNVGRVYQLMFAKVGNRPDAEDRPPRYFWLCCARCGYRPA